MVLEQMQQTLLEALQESKGGSLPKEVVRQLTFQMVKALSYMHSKNVTKIQN